MYVNNVPSMFFKEENGYSVIFPDLEDGHLIICGESLEDAFAMSVDCLVGYVYIAQGLGAGIPQATSVSSVDIARIAFDVYDSKNDYEEAFVNMISVDVAAYAKNILKNQLRKH